MNKYQSYQILGLQEDASIKEVKSAYRKLALKHHPDKNHADRDGKKFQQITEAYQTLRVDYKKSIGSASGHQKYDDKKSNSKYDFGSRKHSWGARESDKTPQEDWTRYTRYAEDAYQDFWKHYENKFWEYYERVKSQAKVETEPIQVEQSVAVSVKVDPERCIACCSCETIAPTVFHVEKNVRVNPKSRVINEDGAKSHKILDAAHTCPTRAISVNEKETQRKLYPY